MATKLARNGSMLEYVTIKPSIGLTASTLADFAVLHHESDVVIRRFDTWNKFIKEVKEIIFLEGLERANYAWESTYDYENKHKAIVAHIKKLNPKLG